MPIDVIEPKSLARAPIAIAFASGACLVAVLATDPAFAASEEGGASVLAPAFSTLDADADGILSEKEWMESSSTSAMSDDVAAAHYAMYDVDGDGGVSAEEYDAVNEEVLGGREEGKAI